MFRLLAHPTYRIPHNQVVTQRISNEIVDLSDDDVPLNEIVPSEEIKNEGTVESTDADTLIDYNPCSSNVICIGDDSDEDWFSDDSGSFGKTNSIEKKSAKAKLNQSTEPKLNDDKWNNKTVHLKDEQNGLKNGLKEKNHARVTSTELGGQHDSNENLITNIKRKKSNEISLIISSNRPRRSLQNTMGCDTINIYCLNCRTIQAQQHYANHLCVHDEPDFSKFIHIRPCKVDMGNSSRSHHYFERKDREDEWRVKSRERKRHARQRNIPKEVIDEFIRKPPLPTDAAAQEYCSFLDRFDLQLTLKDYIKHEICCI